MTTLQAPPRRDYAIFLQFTELGKTRESKSELAVTGTALPVQLRCEPRTIEFDTCPIGQQREAQITLFNESQLKEVRFRFTKIANYTVVPASGRVAPRSSRQVTVAFVPHQIGSTNNHLKCQVIDRVADKSNPLMVLDKAICDIAIALTGNATAISPQPLVKINTGKCSTTHILFQL